jgi:acetoacetyl-[acyl-carrier protein] synthase
LIYKFGEGLLNEADMELTSDNLSFAEFKNSIALPREKPFKDMV